MRRISVAILTAVTCERQQIDAYKGRAVYAKVQAVKAQCNQCGSDCCSEAMKALQQCAFAFILCFSLCLDVAPEVNHVGKATMHSNITVEDNYKGSLVLYS